MAAEWTAIFERLQAGGVPPPGWLTEQRRLAAEGTLDPRRAQLLEQIKNKSVLAWIEKYDRFCELVRMEKRPPKMTDPGQKPLVQWIYYQRHRRKKGRMPPEQAMALEAVPHWSWGATVADRWQEKLELLREYVSEYGRMPRQQTVFKGAWIGIWTSNQLMDKVQGSACLTPARIAALEAIPHWRWRVQGRPGNQESVWQKNLALLREYVENYGQLPKRATEFKGVLLGKWASVQRLAKSQSFERMTPERIAMLESVPGWGWSISHEERWQVHLSLLHEFVEKFGRIPSRSVIYEDFQLGIWVAKQLSAKSEGARRLSPERIAELEAVPLWRWRE